MNISWLGDAALRIEWPASDEDGEGGRAASIAAAAERVRDMHMAEVKELVPAQRSLTVHLDIDGLLERGRRDGIAFGDAVQACLDRIRQALEDGDAAETSDAAGTDRAANGQALEDGDAGAVRLPVFYGGQDGPDLAACARRSGLSPEAFIQAHASATYEVAMIGFAPGFPYLTGLPDALAQPRHATPRLQVPPGAVGIAGVQTGIYPVRSPGGWQWIGRTPVPLFRPDEADPFLLKQGDRVAFVPVAAGEDSIATAIVPHASPEDPIRVRASARVSETGREVAGAEQFEMRKRGLPATRPDGDGSDALEVRKPGMLTTVQDRGRQGWQSFGVSVGGAMDPESLRAANLLVGNQAFSAALEMTAIGAEFLILRDILAAACGGDLDARVDGEAMPLHCPVWLRAGAVLSFGKAKRGCRAYLAVAGGIATPELLGSRSADMRFGVQGPAGRALAAGDRLPAGEPTPLGLRIGASLRAEAGRSGRTWGCARWAAESAAWPSLSHRHPVEVRVLPGVQWEEFPEEARRLLLRERYQVTADSDRMGLRLKGPRLARGGDAELASHGVVPGTIQVPAGGLPIVLAAGCQPTGGYPVIAHVVGADLPLLAQCMPGTELAFRLAEREEAWLARLRAERHDRLLRAGILLAARGYSS